MKKGFKARTSHQEFILSKKYDQFIISLHQAVEPFNPHFGKLIDFNYEEASALIVVHFKEKPLLVGEDVFDHVYLREDYLFLFDDNMEFSNPNTFEKVLLIEELLLRVF